MNSSYWQIAEIIGTEGADALCERLGGCRVYLPACPDPNSQLVLAIGQAAAEALCGAYPGARLELPSRNSLEVRSRRESIVRDLRSGAAVGEVAVKYGLTARRVRAIRAEEAI